MSKCIVEVCTIDESKKHPNADKLEIAIIKGWQCVTQKGLHKAGDKVVYIPPDSVIPMEWSEKFGVTQYLNKGRVRSIKLRGEPSFGLIVKVPYEPCCVGDNVAEWYGITKYDPPPVYTSGGQNPRRGHTPRSWVGRFIKKWTWRLFNMEPETVPELDAFPVYTEIENLRHYNKVLEIGEQVVITEKIHGTNSRLGIINGEEVAGSHNNRRMRPKPPSTFKSTLKRIFRMKEEVSYGDEIKHDYYWYPWSLDSVRTGLQALYSQYGNVVLYGEVYGKVQELKYGHLNDIAFAAFDLMINGKYLDAEAFEHTCEQYAIPRVPVLFTGAFTLEKVKELSVGKTTVPGADNIREGVVVRPVTERTHHKLGRVILKYVGDEYLCSKKCNENKDV